MQFAQPSNLSEDNIGQELTPNNGSGGGLLAGPQQIGKLVGGSQESRGGSFALVRLVLGVSGLTQNYTSPLGLR